MNKAELNIVLRAESPRSATTMNHSHIPIPKISSTMKLHDRLPPRRGSMEKTSGNTVSVAAQRAAFEKLDASAGGQKIRNNINLSNVELRSPEGRLSPARKMEYTSRLNSPLSPKLNSPLSPKLNNPRLNGSNNPNLNRSNSFLESKWKSKYEDSEKRRKLLLQKSEFVNKENAELEKKFQQLQRQNSNFQTQMQNKEQELQKLRTVSEAVCKEYEQLKRQYDVETGAMHKAMQQASQWYRQNRELKRRSQVITQKILESNPDGLPDVDILDEVDSNNEDLEQLRETVRELSKEVARLQTELNSARLQEFEAQEQVTVLTAQLEEEKAARQSDEEKMRELKQKQENMERITRMVADEVQTLKTQCDRERESAKMMKIEADRVQKERNVLAHQSALLMAEIGDEPGGRLMTVLQEVESLKRLLEEEQQNHGAQILLLQEKLEEKESNVEFEIVEEKLRLAESELEVVLQKAERAEKKAENLEEVAKELESKLAEMEAKRNQPPPPPPPPPPPMFANNQSSLKLITREKMSGERESAVSDMEKMLGITKKPSTILQQPAIDDIINQIKGGRFTLKHTEKEREEERRRKQEAESAPPAVSEMLNILGTMRRRAKPTRQSFKFANGSS